MREYDKLALDFFGEFYRIAASAKDCLCQLIAYYRSGKFLLRKIQFVSKLKAVNKMRLRNSSLLSRRPSSFLACPNEKLTIKSLLSVDICVWGKIRLSNSVCLRKLE